MSDVASSRHDADTWKKLRDAERRITALERRGQGGGLMFHIPGAPTVAVYEAYYPSFSGRIASVRASADGAPSGGSCVVDLLISGASAFSTATKPTIASGSNFSPRAYPDVKSWAADDSLEIEVESVNGATGVIVEIRML